MPFTFAHPAIVLPLLSKRWKVFSATALIAGSIAPDFESFIGLGADKEYSHTWSGVFWFDMPLALLLSIVFHVLVKVPLIDHLPGKLSARFQELRETDWIAFANKHYIIVITSCFLGILTHMAWDAFTHLNVFYPDSITSRLMWHGHRVYILLQYSNSVLGLVLLALFVGKLPSQPVPKRKVEKYKFWLFFVLIAAAIMVFVVTSLAEEAWLHDWIYLINACLGAMMYALITVAVFHRFVIKWLPE